MGNRQKTGVGVYLNIEPNFGGVFQYALSIILGLESLDKAQYELYCFYDNDLWDKYLNERFIKVKFSSKKFNRFLMFPLKVIFQSPTAWRISGRWSDAVKKINSSKCDIIFFPSQDSASYQINKKSISTIHDLMHRYEPHFEEYGQIESIRRDLHYASICKFADKILVDSNVGKRHVIESYPIEPSKLEILPFVPPKYLQDANDLNIWEKYSLPNRFIFYPAQFWEHKNHENLIRAVKICIEQGSEINLVLVGSKKNNYSKIINLVKELGLERYVFILGYVSNDEMGALYKNAVAMIFASLIGPTNIPPMEAMMMGCPLICSNTYGMPEQVGDAALLVDPRDPREMADKIELVWSNDGVRRSLINAGFKKIGEYSQINFNKKLEKIICTIKK